MKKTYFILFIIICLSTNAQNIYGTWNFDWQYDTTIIENYENGNLKCIQHFKNRKREGEYKEYSYNGKLHYTVNYVEGKINGKEILYYENGQKGMETTFKNDSLIDSIYTWYSNGKKMKVNCPYPYNYEEYFDSFEENFGIGKLDLPIPEYSQTKEVLDSLRKQYYVYEKPDDKEPAKYSGNFVSLSDVWFFSDIEIGIGYHAKVLLIKEQGQWCQIMVGFPSHSRLSDRRKFWIKKSALKCNFTPWEQLIVGDYLIIDGIMRQNKLYKSSEIHAEKTECAVSCSHITKANGEFAYVLEYEYNYNASKNCTFNHCEGWIRWRDDHQLLIWR